MKAKRYCMAGLILVIFHVFYIKPAFALSAQQQYESFFKQLETSEHSEVVHSIVSSFRVISTTQLNDDRLILLADNTIYLAQVKDTEVSITPIVSFDHNVVQAIADNETIFAVVDTVTPGYDLYKFAINAKNNNKQRFATIPSHVSVHANPLLFDNELYLLLDNAVHKLDATENRWNAVSTSIPIDNGISIVVGKSHIAFIEKNKTNPEIWLFETHLNKLVSLGKLSFNSGVLHASFNDDVLDIATEQTSTSYKSIITASNFSYWDYGVILILLSVLLYVGTANSKKDKGNEDYFKAQSRIPWWAASLSLFATNSSAITLMAMPAMAFTSNWTYFSIGLFLLLIQFPLFTLVYVPVIRRLKITTSNHYLEKRFGVSTRLLGFLGFSLNQVLGRMAAIMLLPATALNAIFGLDMNHSIIFMGICTTIFVTLGGLSAVIWTDVIQAFIMIIAVVVCGYFALVAIDFPLSEMQQIVVNQDKLKMFDLRLDYAAPVVIVLFFNCLAQSLSYIGDQNFVQRVQCTNSESSAKKAAISQLFVAIPLNFLLFSLGTVLFLYYYNRPELLPPALAQDGILPFFAAQTLPAGLTGIVVIALLAATISTVSSAMNSVANLCVEDIYQRFAKSTNTESSVRIARIITLCIGVLGTLAAIFLANISSLKSLWDLFLMVTGMLLSPITGMFVLGIFTKRANQRGVWIGVLTAIAVNYYFVFHSSVHPMVYIVVGTFSTVIIGYLASRILGGVKKDLKGLTIFTLDKPLQETK
jgi:SSS family transporter